MSSEEIDTFSDSEDCLEIHSDDYSIIDLDDDNLSLEEDEKDNTDFKILYSFPTETTSSGVSTHRMRYQTLTNDDIILRIDQKMKILSDALQLDSGKCLILYLEYSWNDHKLMDDYLNTIDQEKFLLDHGTISKKIPEDLKILLTVSKNANDLCSICYCGPDIGEPMEFFQLYNCGHKFCTDCYIQYIKSKNETSCLLIDCPFHDPKCHFKITIQEMKTISDFALKNREFNENNTKLHFISEDQVVELYDLTSDEEQFDEFGNIIDQFDEFGEVKDNKKKTEAEKKAEINDLIFDFHNTMKKREIEEIQFKRNRTLLSKYWYNISNQYCLTQGKKFANCPYPDCDCIVECLGFDSNHVVTIQEQIDLLLVPIVKCSRDHLFCYNCLETYHAPCPCQIVAKWKKKCEDDSETLNWIQSNTKDCPKCHAIIEKNGGCNHMVCTKCRYQFCWICMKSWLPHSAHHICTRYKENDKNNTDGVRANLKRYMFYFDHFNTQRISHNKDRKILEEFEKKIRELQVENGVSWIETVFYKECVSALLECRQALKWSYAFLFYVPKCHGKELIETAQWQLSNKVEVLSKLFEETPVSSVIIKKNSFLSNKSSMLSTKEKFLETCVDIFADQNTLQTFKKQLQL